MKKYLILILATIILSSCVQDNFHEGELSNPNFNGSMMEYLESDPYNWSMAVEIIKKAATTPGEEWLLEIFEGTNSQYPEVTFFGFTNHSVRRWMYSDNWVKRVSPGLSPSSFDFLTKPVYQKVSEIPVEDCVYFVKSHILLTARKKSDFPEGDVTPSGPVGGEMINPYNGGTAFIYVFNPNTKDLPDMNPKVLKMWSLPDRLEIGIASPDIHPTNGYVHSLSYNYKLGDLK